MMAAHIPPEVATHTAMHATTGSRSCGAAAVRGNLAGAAMDICFIPGQGVLILTVGKTKKC